MLAITPYPRRLHSDWLYEYPKLCIFSWKLIITNNTGIQPLKAVVLFVSSFIQVVRLP